MTRDISSVKRRLQWASVVLILISAAPCLLTYINIPSVIQYAIETKGNQGLQLFIYLFLASCLNGIALLLLIRSLTLKENSN